MTAGLNLRAVRHLLSTGHLLGVPVRKDRRLAEGLTSSTRTGQLDRGGRSLSTSSASNVRLGVTHGYGNFSVAFFVLTNVIFGLVRGHLDRGGNQKGGVFAEPGSRYLCLGWCFVGALPGSGVSPGVAMVAFSAWLYARLLVLCRDGSLVAGLHAWRFLSEDGSG